MRTLLLACLVLVAACSTVEPGEPAAPADAGAAVLPPEKPLPDYKPETAAACNAVRLSVAMGADAGLKVNGASVDMAGLEAAAARKNAACPNAPAMVALAIAPGTPGKQADAVRDVLARGIANIALVEASTN